MKIFNTGGGSLPEIDRLIMQVVNTFTDIIHSLVQSLFQLNQGGVHSRFPGNGSQCAHHKDGTGKHVSYIVMNLPGNAVPFL